MEEKVAQILQLQKDGFTRSEIAEKFGYKREDSLQKYMRKRGYIYLNNKYTLLNDISAEEEHVNEAAILPNETFNTESKALRSYTLAELENKITPELRKEYNNIKSKYTVNELKILGILFLSESIIETEGKNSEKKNALIKNVKTFIERAIKYDCSKTLDFLKSKNVPIDLNKASLDSIDIKNVLCNSSELNDYFNLCSIEHLEVIKKGLASINAFSDNLVKALRKE